MKIHLIRLVTFFVWLMVQSCASPDSSHQKKTGLHETESFKKYWYNGQAEINTFHLEQSRYGETREGKAVLIFVSEDFSRLKEVKLDRPEIVEADKVNVLKMNFTKNFVTGIYPYSMMLSVFTPTDRSSVSTSLKATMSSQEWCGQVFTQLNLRNNKYQIQSFSYFENEGDQSIDLKLNWLEDELWNLIRLDPTKLPTGTINIVPGLFFSRLLHTDLVAVPATVTLNSSREEMIYQLIMPTHDRMLTIHFLMRFPYQIIGWEEQFLERGKEVLTKASLDKTLRMDYWTKNENKHIGLRDSLGLSPTNF
jgi:hypothetical protein